MNAPMSDTEFGAYLIALGVLMVSKNLSLVDAQEPREHTDKRAMELNGCSMGIRVDRYAYVEQQARAQLAAIPEVLKVREALNGYYDALTARQHGGVAMDKAISTIEQALGMSWEARKEEKQ